jgi:threonine/homoserine/homoserine lactone efflux protein
MPRWMRTVDEFTIVRAAAAGFALSALNPKNMMLAAAAASEVAGFGLPGSQQVVVVVAFVLLASVGVLAPVVAALVLGERSREPLAAVRTWLGRHTTAIMAALFLVIGAKLIGDALAGLAS